MAENQPETASPSYQPSSTSYPNSSQDPLKRFHAPAFFSFPAFPNGYYQMFPVMYPALVPGLMPSEDQDQMNRGAGIYAVPVYPSMGRVTGLPSNTLIPLTYSIPTRSSSEAGTVGENQGQAAQQPHQPQQQQQQPGHQRQVVVRRFQIAFQIDLLLMLKLAAMVFLFNQDGSRQRLVVLVFFACIVYLYQTGALKPIVRWLSQGMQRAAAQPLPPRPAGGQAEGEIGNRHANDADHGVEYENVAEPGAGNGGNQWWGIVKEIQMILFGFITSLLPGFHFHNHHHHVD